MTGTQREPLPDALGLFHARFRLGFSDDFSIRYDGPSVAGLYLIDVYSGGQRVIVEYDPQRTEPFGVNERTTADLAELLSWIEELLAPTPA